MSHTFGYGDVLSRFQCLRPARQAGFWTARCPAHDDRSPSMSLWVGRNGCLCLGCWSGCAKTLILRAVGLTWADLFPPKETAQRTTGRRLMPTCQIAATYDYRDEAGAHPLSGRAPRAQSLPPAPTGRHDWIWNLDGIDPLPYRLPLLLSSRVPPFDPKDGTPPPILVCEGEKDVDAILSLGMVATSGSGGKWPLSHGRCLAAATWWCYPTTTRRARSMLIPSSCRACCGTPRVCGCCGCRTCQSAAT